MSIWYFEERDRRAVLTFPKNEEHFAAVSGVVTSLIREITQNSGDAGVGSETVQVLFRFGKLDGTRFADHIEGLSVHLNALSDFRAVLEPGKTVPYLAIEDFGTTGLRGSYDLSAEGADSNYVAFWRRYGESSKTDEHGGRHGLGKSTISTASKLRLFFGATVRSEDPAHHLLLQGQISLRPHKIGPKVFGAYGLWYDDTGNFPIIDKPATRFLRDFNLNRGREPGLSVVIPFPHDDLTPDSIIRNVIEHAFHQIISGQLIVKVDDTTISSTTIPRLAETHQLQRLKAAMALSADVRRARFPRFGPRPDNNTRVRMRADHFSKANLHEMRKRWAEGEIVAVDMPVTIRPKKPGAKSGIGTIGLYVRREQDAELARETYVRGRVTVPLKQIASRSNCVGLLVADTGIASTFLGDAEPPAHHRWHMYRVRPHYHTSDATLKRILFSLKDFLDLLEEGQDDQPFKDAFLEYLWFPKRDEEEDNRPTPKLKPSPQPTPFPDDLVPAITPHRLRRIDGGFAYSYNPEDKEDANAQIVASYRRRIGAKKAGKSARFRDFTDELPVEESGSADLEQVPEPRRVVFRLSNISPGYELQVTGFDTNRDIDLRFGTVNV